MRVDCTSFEVKCRRVNLMVVNQKCHHHHGVGTCIRDRERTLPILAAASKLRWMRIMSTLSLLNRHSRDGQKTYIMDSTLSSRCYIFMCIFARAEHDLFDKSFRVYFSRTHILVISTRARSKTLCANASPVSRSSSVMTLGCTVRHV